MATGDKVNSDQLLGEVSKRLEQNKTGPYQAEVIRQARKEYENLDKLVNQGSLSQSDYAKISDYIRQYVTPIGNQGTQGKAPSLAVNAAGWYEIQNNFRNAEIYKNATNLLGREITPTEFAQIAPRFGTGSPQDIEIGRAYLAQFAEQEAKTPQALRSKAPQYSGDVNSIFNDLLKRGASKEEIDHFGGLLASGEVDAYTLRQFVSQLPEYTSAKDAESRTALNQELSNYDRDFFGKAKEDVISRYAKAGIQNSPSLDFALTNLMGDIQKERSRYMAGLAREDYSRGRDVQRQDYGASMDQFLSDRNYGRQRSDQYSDTLTNRAFGSIDYQRQQDDLLRLLSNQSNGRRRSGIGGLIGGAAGAGIGALVPGGMGIAPGAQIGMGIGSYLDY